MYKIFLINKFIIGLVPSTFFTFSSGSLRPSYLKFVYWLLNVTINNTSAIYMTTHRCAGGLNKKFDLRSGSHGRLKNPTVNILS